MGGATGGGTPEMSVIQALVSRVDKLERDRKSAQVVDDAAAAVAARVAEEDLERRFAAERVHNKSALKQVLEVCNKRMGETLKAADDKCEATSKRLEGMMAAILQTLGRMEGAGGQGKNEQDFREGQRVGGGGETRPLASHRAEEGVRQRRK